MGQLFSSFYHNHLIDIKLNPQLQPPKPEPEPEPEPSSGRWVLKDLTDEVINKWTLKEIKSLFEDQEYLKVLQSDTALAWKILDQNKHVNGIVMANIGVLSAIPGAMQVAMAVQSYSP